MFHEGGNVVRLEIGGRLTRAEFARSEADLARELDHLPAAKLLCIVKGFEGWESRADWNDLSFYLEHGDAIERIAIVGDERWRSELLMFAAADLRRAPVEFFAEHDVAAARSWLSA
jgi:hypothetical protein